MLDLVTDHIDSDKISVALIHELFAEVRPDESCSSDDALVITHKRKRERQTETGVSFLFPISFYRTGDVNVLVAITIIPDNRYLR